MEYLFFMMGMVIGYARGVIMESHGADGYLMVKVDSLPTQEESNS